MDDYEPMTPAEAEDLLRKTPRPASGGSEDFARWMEAVAVSAGVNRETVVALRHRILTLGN